MVGFGIIIPVLPFYAKELGVSPAELDFLISKNRSKGMV